MSLFTELHTFAAWAEKELGKLEKDAPAIEKTSDSILQYVGGAATILAGIEGGPAASAEVKSVVSGIQTGVVALGGLITDFGASPTAATIASSLAANAGSLLTASHITNPTSVAAANGIITNLTSLATALSAPKPA